MSRLEDALLLEALMPRAIVALFHSGAEDELRHNSVGQVRLMRTLFEGSRTASDLSQLLGLSPSSLTQMASRLILAGLVTKELDPHDRRVRMVSLSPAGRALMESRQARRSKTAAKLLERMEPERLLLLIDILKEIASYSSVGLDLRLEVAV